MMFLCQLEYVTKEIRYDIFPQKEIISEHDKVTENMLDRSFQAICCINVFIT